MNRWIRVLAATLMVVSVFACTVDPPPEPEVTTTTEPEEEDPIGEEEPNDEDPAETPTTTTQPETTLEWTFTDGANDVVGPQGEELDDQFVDLTELLSRYELAAPRDGKTFFVFTGYNTQPKAEPSYSRAFQLQLGQIVGTSFLPSSVFNWQTHDGTVSSGAVTAATGAPLDVEFEVDFPPDFGHFEFLIPTSALPVDFNAFAFVAYHMEASNSPRSTDIAGPFDLGGSWNGIEWTTR